MADGTQLPTGGGGDKIWTEDTGSASGKIPRSKIAIGALDTDGGDVTVTNPFPVSISDTVQVIGTSAHPIRTDPTGTTTQPVSGTVAVSSIANPLPAGTNAIGGVTQSGSWNVGITGTVTVSGTVTATLSATTNAGATAKTFDLDTGVGTDTVTAFAIALPASGGAVVGGTATNPIRTDPTGTTTQPVSGTVSISGTPNVAVTSLPGTSFAGQTAVTLDYDTGVGVQNLALVGLALPASGGAVAGGTISNPLRVDPTGTTTQPVSGTVSISGTPTVTVSGTVTADTELSAAAALADATANPTTALVGACLEGFNGTTWDRLRVDGSKNLLVAVNAALPTGTNVIGALSANQSVNVAQVGGSAVATGHGTAAGSLRVELPTDGTGLVNAAQSGTWTVQPGNTQNSTPWLTGDTPVTAGGLSSSSFISTAAVQSTAAKASPGQVYSLSFFNNSSTPVYVRLYNQTSAPASTDGANILWRGIVPGNTGAAGFVKYFPGGLAFSTGIGYRVTGAIADNDTTALSANTIIGNVEYK